MYVCGCVSLINARSQRHAPSQYFTYWFVHMCAYMHVCVLRMRVYVSVYVLCMFQCGVVTHEYKSKDLRAQARLTWFESQGVVYTPLRIGQTRWREWSRVVRATSRPGSRELSSPRRRWGSGHLWWCGCWRWRSYKAGCSPEHSWQECTGAEVWSQREACGC